MIVFNTLKFEGFQGQADFKVFKLDQPGLNVITGKNGCGKSTIFNALSWVLYGRPLKEKATVETWEHLRGKDYRGTMVTLSLLIGGHKYKITRCKKYKGTIYGTAGRDRLIFEKNGDIFLPNVKDKRDIQRGITEILGMSYELFTNTIIFPQRVTRFIESTGAEKKKILEQSFSLGWLNEMLAKAKDKRLQAITLASEQLKTIEGIETSINDIDDMLDAIDESRKEFETEKTNIIDSIGTSIGKLEKKVNETIKPYGSLKGNIKATEQRIETLLGDALHTDYAETEKKVQELIPKRINANNKRQHAYKHWESLRSQKACPECGQEYPKKDRSKAIREAKKEHDDWVIKFDDLDKEIRPLEQDLIGGNNVRKEITELQSDLRNMRKTYDEQEKDRLLVEGAKGQLLELRAQLKFEKEREFKDLSAPLLRKKFLLEAELKKEKDKVRPMERNKKLYAWIANVPLSNTGIKAFLFDNLLETLNNRIVYYERFTGIGVELEVDMQGARKDINTIVTKDQYPVSYHDLSGGESQLVNTVMALGQNDILTIDNPSNLYVMDEVFEGLDPENIDTVGSLLADKAKDKALFVITHNNAFIPQNANLIRMSNGKG